MAADLSACVLLFVSSVDYFNFALQAVVVWFVLLGPGGLMCASWIIKES